MHQFSFRPKCIHVFFESSFIFLKALRIFIGYIQYTDMKAPIITVKIKVLACFYSIKTKNIIIIILIIIILRRQDKSTGS